MDSTRTRLPALMAFVAAALWGLWWMPIRWLAGQGLDGALGGLAMLSGAAVACLVWLVLRRVTGPIGPRAWVGAALIGVAFTTYSAALSYGEVVRVILLFYLAPVWSKIIERVFLGLAWHWTSTLALGLALSGALLLLGTGAMAGRVGGGDALALVSGLSWSAGSALVFTAKRAPAMGLTAITMICTVLVSLLFVFVDGVPAGVAGQGRTMLPVLGIAALAGAVYVIPVMFLTLWSAQRLAPATLSFLLTAELLSGVISSAIWLDEPFGMAQGLGAVLILAAALAEVLKPGTAPARG